MNSRIQSYWPSTVSWLSKSQKGRSEGSRYSELISYVCAALIVVLMGCSGKDSATSSQAVTAKGSLKARRLCC